VAVIRRGPTESPFAVGVLLLLLATVGGPIAVVVWMSLRRGLPGLASPLGLENYAALPADPFFQQALGNTVVFAALSLLVTFVFLVPLTILFSRTDLPFRTPLVVLLSVVILIPTFLRAIGWIMLLSPEIGIVNRALVAVFALREAPLNVYTMGGMAFVQGLAFVPAGYFMLSPAFRAMDPALEEAAYTSGLGRVRTFVTVDVPLATPALLGTLVYLAMTAVAAFEAPGIIGTPARIFVLSSLMFVDVHPQSVGLPDYGAAGAIGMILLVLGVVLSVAYVRAVRASRTYAVVSGRGYRPRTLHLGHWKPLALAFVVIFFTMEIVLPLGMLVWASLTPYLIAPSAEALSLVSLTNYGRMFTAQSGRAIVNTVVVLALAPLLATAIAVAAAWVVTRTRSRLRGAIDMLAFAPHAVPAVLIAVALSYLALVVRGSIPLYGSVLLIALADGIVFVAFASRTLNAAMIQVHAELEEAGRVGGLSPVGTLRHVILPLVRPALLNSWFWVALLSYREVTMALVLFTQFNDVLSTEIWTVWREGDAGRVAALGVSLIALLLVMVATVALAVRRWPVGRGATMDAPVVRS
jgi:iron(III) transport system permease protein